jgi:hypothetical protein
MSDELSEQHTIASNLKGASEPVETPFESRWATALAGDRKVLGELAADCWSPIYAWLRSFGSTPEEAARRVQEFPTWLQLHPPRPDAEDFMRFSDYVQNRLGMYADAGFPPINPVVAVTIDQSRAERKFAEEGSRSPEEVFARRWAFMILEWTLSTLRAELDADGKVAQFTYLKSFLNFSGGTRNATPRSERKSDSRQVRCVWRFSGSVSVIANCFGTGFPIPCVTSPTWMAS